MKMDMLASSVENGLKSAAGCRSLSIVVDKILMRNTTSVLGRHSTA